LLYQTPAENVKWSFARNDGGSNEPATDSIAFSRVGVNELGSHGHGADASSGTASGLAVVCAPSFKLWSLHKGFGRSSPIGK